MGYDLYITRAESWLDRESFPIPKSEWEAVVRSDRELQLSVDDWYDRDVDGTVERHHPVLWMNHPDRVPFWYLDGAIETKNPDDRTIRKMVELAGRLGARVLGEEDEVYGADGNAEDGGG